MPDFAPYRPDVRGLVDPAVVIRAATDVEAGALAEFESRVRGTTNAVDAMVGAIADPLRLVVVALAGGTVVGWAKTHYWDRGDGPAEAGHYLCGVTVDPRWRRRGVARALTGARMRWIGQRASVAWYFVNARNLASIDLHRAWGFEEVARAGAFHGIAFSGGVGVLLRAECHR